MHRYISLFTGIGGLESADSKPILCCESDEACQMIIKRRFPNVPIHPDIRKLNPPTAEITVGGWPCQDISVAGLRLGLKGERSGLFFELLRVAEKAHSHTIIAENVPNLLNLERGKAFQLILDALSGIGLKHVAWRHLNAREFGLPHQRNRVFIVASRHREIALALHRPIVHRMSQQTPGSTTCNGFYWTAGIQSICYSIGFAPTLKVGSSLAIPSPPALHYASRIRKASPDECLKLQGFKPKQFSGVRPKDAYRMAGNAVAAPVGRFVMDCVGASRSMEPTYEGFGYLAANGVWDGSLLRALDHAKGPLATNLCDFVDMQEGSHLSSKAAAGLLSRLKRSGKPCPPEVLHILEGYSQSEDRKSSDAGASYTRDALPLPNVS